MATPATSSAPAAPAAAPKTYTEFCMTGMNKTFAVYGNGTTKTVTADDRTVNPLASQLDNLTGFKPTQACMVGLGACMNGGTEDACLRNAFACEKLEAPTQNQANIRSGIWP